MKTLAQKQWYDYNHTMSYQKIAITVPPTLLSTIDNLVASKQSNSRSGFFQDAAQAHLDQLKTHSLTEACQYLSVNDEQSLAEEGFNKDSEAWPKF